MDSLEIKGLTVSTRIGVYQWEQKINQKLVVDISIPRNFKDCGDRIEETLDYEKLCQQVTQFIETNSFQLIETVANGVAQLLKTNFNLKEISLSVSKPQAIKNAADVKVCVKR